MPIYPYSFQLPPLNVQDIPNDGAVGEFLGISAGGVLDWLPVSASGSGDMLKSENLSGLADYPTARTNLGLGTGDSPQFKNLVISTGTITTDAPVTISQTWNGTGSTPFTALKVNATTPGTTSSSGSLLLDLQVGTVSKFKVDKAGNASIGSGQFVMGTDGLNNYSIQAYQGPTKVGRIGFNEIGNNIVIAPFANTHTIFTGDIAIGSNTVFLRRDADNTLALRNGTNAQTFNVYGTSSSSNSVYERMFAKYNGTDLAFQIGTETSGATLRPLDFVTGGSRRMTIGTTGNVGIGTTAPSSKLHVEGASPTVLIKNSSASGFGTLSFSNTIAVSGNDIWQNGSAQAGYGGPSSLNIQASSGPLAFHTATVTNAISLSQAGVATFASGINVTAAYQSGLNFVSRSKILCGADGTFLLTTNATTNFNKLNFGVQSDSFPALKISGTKLQVVLGSTDTTFTNIQGKLTTDTDYTATTIVPTGFLTLYDAQGTAYRVPCVAA